MKKKIKIKKEVKTGSGRRKKKTNEVTLEKCFKNPPSLLFSSSRHRQQRRRCAETLLVTLRNLICVQRPLGLG